MPAPIATLLDALVTTLNGGDAQELLGGVTARRAYQETQNFKAQESASLFLSPYEWRTLGVCGGLRLQQHLVQLSIARRDLTASNAGGDADQAIAETVRTLLATFDDPAGRVVDILGPLTVDRERLLSPGQSAVSLLLDCDVLLTPEEPPESDSATSILTVARSAIWDVVHHWPALTSLFARKYQTDADIAELQLRDPAPQELPAIALYWGGIEPDWKYSRTQLWPMTLRAALWFPGDRHTLAERGCEDFFDALYRAKPDGDSRTFLEAAIGYPPKRVGSMAVSSVTLGRAQQLKAVRVDVAFTLRTDNDPFGEET